MAPPAPPPRGHPTDRILGHCPAIHALRAQIQQLAPFDAPGSPLIPTVLLQGETGVGKGLVARVIHDSGPRAWGPFIEVNCAAIPETLLEAELFDYAAGAFTDAKRAKPGLFETASGGTLFLDEIDALPVALQGKLLTVIEAKQVRRLGAVAERAIDCKLIAATKVELREEVSRGGFRADLFHRLAVVVWVIPPLWERGGDMVLLARHFLAHLPGGQGLGRKELSLEAEAWLPGYGWPGNVRELRHLLERVVLFHPEAVIERETLVRWCLPSGVLGREGNEGALASPHQRTGTDEPAQIREALQQTGGMWYRRRGC